MTAKTSEILAMRLDAVGLHILAANARADQYHDFLSDDALCSMTLEQHLRDARDACPDPVRRIKIEDIRQDHLEGMFDASKEESDEWAASPDGQETFGSLLGKKDE
jgi:hypothetical protein